MNFQELSGICIAMVLHEKRWKDSEKLDDESFHLLVNSKLDLDEAISPTATEWSRPGRVLLCAMFEPITKVYEQLNTILSNLEDDDELAEDIRSILDELWYMTPHELLKSNSGN